MSSLIETPRETFYSLNDEALIQSLFHPSLKQIRGRDYAFKKSILKTIPKAHRSLFMFISLYYHNTMGWNSFMTAFSIYFPHGYLSDIKGGLKYLKCEKLLDIITQCEEIYYSDRSDSCKTDLFKTLDEEYQLIKEKTFQNVIGYIKEHVEEFVHFTD